MSKPEWGIKRTCTTCAARFYDLNKDPIVCPKCGAENEKDVTKLRRSSKSARPDAGKKVVAGRPASEPIEEEILEVEADDEDDGDEGDLMEDTSDLGEDDEDMAEVIEHIESGDEEE